MRKRNSQLRKAVVAAIVCLLFAACNNDGPKEAGLALLKTTNPPPVAISDREDDLIHSIKKDLEQFDELYDVAIIKGSEDVLVAYKVRHMKRFWMKDIEKKLNERLKKKYPDEKITISSDYKIFLEAVELKENMEDPHFPKSEAEKKLKQIIKLKNKMA